MFYNFTAALKLTTKIFSTLNLVFFLTSFTLMVADSFGSQNNSGLFSKFKLYTSKKTGSAGESLNQATENDENDSDSSFDQQGVFIPQELFISDFQIFLIKQYQVNFPLTISTESIYLALHNFRI